MKRFYNNTLIGGAFSKALRAVALLCVLLGFSSSAWGETYYLWYNAKSNEPNYKNSNFDMSAGAILTNNKCVWTISNLRKDNSYFYISTSSTYSESNLKSVNITVNYPNNDAVVNAVGKQDYSGKVGFYVSCKTAGSTVTITIDFSSNSQYVVSPVGGGAAACTPSATITGASYDGTKITLSGTVTEVCTSSVTTWYGWQYKTDVNAEWSTSTYIAGKAGSNQHQTKTAPVNYTNTWTGFEKGKTYYFRAYALQNNTWYSDNKILSVTIPNGGGSTGEADCSGIIYLNPGVWEHTDGQRYAAFFFNGTSSDVWVDMVATTSGGECAGLYYVETPDGGYKNVLFGRMNPERSDNSFTHKDQGGPMYNQTENCTITEGKNLYSITGWSDGDDSKSGVGTPTKSDCTDGCIPAEQPSTNVLLSREAIVNKSAKTAQLFGYLKSIKAPDCPSSAITDYGFFYCMVNDGDTPCLPLPTSSSTKLQVSPSDALLRGEEFTATVGLIKEPSDALQDGKTYYYRAYAKIDDKYILSGEIRSFSTDPCIPQYGGLSDKYVDGTPIVYTINADPAFAANDCKLHFNSLQDAIEHLKTTKDRDNDYKYVDGSYNLLQPVEMRVVYYDDTPDDPTSAYIYRGTTNVGVYAGDNKPANANLIQDFNKSANADPANTLTIKAGTKVAKPWIHHLVIRNSRNIVLDSLCIYSDPNKVGDNALEIDVNSTGWDVMTTGQFADANIVIQNSMIGSDGFTGVHVSAYDGITFKKNDFEIVFEGKTTDGNVLNWSASAKFMMCKNIKFIQNNFRGSQPTMLWLQECQNALFMNNVFWNTNTFIPAEGSKAVVPSAVRLVSQYANEIDNIGFYYNTFYFANNDINAPWAKYNFFNQYLAYTNASQANIDKYGSNIYFKYNNCYSYDKDCPGMYDIVGSATGGGANMTYTTVTATSDSENFCPNNFWSQYDQDKLDKGETVTKSAFAFGCADNKFINVKSQVCSTTASGPASLIVKGKGMDYGVKPDISTTGITLEPNEQYADRYIIGARPENGEKWTYGAYQSKDNIDTKVIYWVGISSDWDDRNNWEYETEVDGKMVRQRVSCVNNLSEDLKVVVEEIGTVEIADGRKWPQIPASFTENRTNSLYDEHVSAGLGTGKTPTKFASTIELEYGAGIKGVENLREADGTLRYDRAITHFEAERNKWLLVGPMVRPFVSGNSGTTRDVISNDYFKNFEPHIYMHETTIDGDKVSWNKTFGDLNVPILPNTVFAMQASKDYGPYFDNAEDYLKYEGIEVDDKSPTPFTFTGRFAVEEGQHNNNGNYVYSLENGINLLNNVYPCNLNVQKLEELGNVSLYDYDLGSFVSTTGKNARVLAVVRSQNGFVFTPKYSDLTLELSQELLTEGSTRTRSGEIVMPSFSLNIDNANTTKPGASNIVISYDEFLGSDESLRNTPKVFTKNTDTPEAYIVYKDAKYSRLVSGKEKVSIPVDIRLLKPMNLTFEKVYNEGYDEVVLVDTKTQKFYNLLKRTYTTDVLSAGDTEGRFYLNLTVSGDDDLDDEGDNPGGDDLEDDDDVTTEVEETIEETDINIYAVDNSIIRVIAIGTTLKAIYVNDMAGRTEEFLVDGNFAELQLPVSSGVYTVHVIGDTATKIGKVILK